MIIYRVCTESNEDGSAFGAKSRLKPIAVKSLKPF